MAPKRNPGGRLLDREHGRARLLGTGALVLDRGALLPLGHRLRVDPVAPGENSQALLTMLDRSTHCRRRAGAPMQTLAHSASFHYNEKSAPPKPGTKHLAVASFGSSFTRATLTGMDKGQDYGREIHEESSCQNFAY